MKLRIASFIIFLLLFLASAFFAQRFAYQTFSYSVSGENSGLSALLRSKNDDSGDSLLICSHGTNSHKEVFLPLALIMATHGFSCLLIDSSTLSTDEGINLRVKEILAAKAISEKRLRPFSRVVALGHSDGGPPSLALMHKNSFYQAEVVILGSQLSETVPANIPVKGFIGGFDQIFPVAEVIADFNKISNQSGKVKVSWLSDHFTEQYDPILLSAITESVLKTKSVTPLSVGAGLLVFALAVIFSFVAGLLTGEPGPWRPYYAIGIAIFTWVSIANGAMNSLFSFPSTIALPLSFMLGFNAGFVPAWRHIRPFLIFFLLMELNVVIATQFFRDNLSTALPWLPVFLLWHPFAWVCKMSLFCTSLMHRALPWTVSHWHLPLLLLTTLPFVLRKGILPPCLSFIKPGAKSQGAADDQESGLLPDKKQQFRLAALLVLTMLGLWAVRFSQGMIQTEILQAVAGNFLKTLLLPCIYLIYLVCCSKTKS